MCCDIPLVRNTTLYSIKSQCLCEGRRNIIFDDTNNCRGGNWHNADLLLSSCNVDFGSGQVLVEQLGPFELSIGDGALVLQVTQNGENKQEIGGFCFRFNNHSFSPFLCSMAKIQALHGCAHIFAIELCGTAFCVDAHSVQGYGQCFFV